MKFSIKIAFCLIIFPCFCLAQRIREIVDENPPEDQQQKRNGTTLATGPEIVSPPHALEALNSKNGTDATGPTSKELPVPMEGFLPTTEHHNHNHTHTMPSTPTTTTMMSPTASTGQVRLQILEPEGPLPQLPAPLGDCTDGHPNCPFWAKNGFCQNQFYSQQTRVQFCPSSCGLC